MSTAEGAGVAVPPQLERQALKALGAPELCAPPLPAGFVTLARLWAYEGQGAWRAWSISSRPSAIDAAPLRIRGVVWNRPGERARLAEPTASEGATPPPLLELREGRFPTESWLALLEEIGALKVAPFLPEASPEGGAADRWGLEYRTASRTVSFEWWDTPPTEWTELVEWAAKVRATLDAWLKR